MEVGSPEWAQRMCHNIAARRDLGFIGEILDFKRHTGEITEEQYQSGVAKLIDNMDKLRKEEDESFGHPKTEE